MDVELIDGRGNLFGRWNVIDVMVVVFVCALGIAGIALVGGGGASATETTTVTVEVVVSPSVAGALEGAQPAPGSDVAGVGESQVVRTLPVNESQIRAGESEKQIVRVDLTLETGSENGLVTFRGERLYVGSSVEVDVTSTVIDGTVVGMEGVR